MGFIHDLRFGLRVLAGSPGFATLAILTVGLGIGVNSTVFTLVNGVFLRGLPFDDPNEIVEVRVSGRGGGISYPDYEDLRRQARSFRDLGAYRETAVDLSDGESSAARAEGAQVTANAFPLLGQGVELGRLLLPEDMRPGAERVALISYGVWQTRYGGSPNIVGTEIRLSLEPHTIVGVMPQGEGFPDGTDIWTPLVADSAVLDRNERTLEVFGRLADGVSPDEARVEITTLVDALASEFRPEAENLTADVQRFTDLDGEIVVVFTALQGAVTFVLLIACANVANLLLSRAIGRTRETAIRTAVGATRWRIIRQLLVESLTMSALGGLVGLGLTYIGVRLFWNAVANTGPPYWLQFPLDFRVFAYFAAISVISGILFGLAPALQVSKTDVNENLKEGGRGTSGGVRARRFTGAMLVGQVALTFVLLVGAGLMIRSFLNTQRVELGFDPTGILTARITLRPEAYPEADTRIAFIERLSERVGQIPGVETVTVASNPPASGALFVSGLTLEGQEPFELAPGSPPDAWRVSVAPGYFESLGVGIVGGREFAPADGEPGSEAAIVNEAFIERYWPGENPLGRRLKLSNAEDAPWLEVVGVGPPIFHQGFDNNTAVEPTVYTPFRQDPNFGTNLIVRSPLPPDTVAAAMRAELGAMDPDMPLYDIRTLEEILHNRNWPYRVFGSLFAIFALIALVMSSVGIYGVTAYHIGQRTSEIGIRIALGATRRDVLWMVMRQGLFRIAAGLAIGLALAWAVSRLLESVLVGVTPTDPVTFGAIQIILTAVTLAACLIPSRKALRLDPADALRVE
jgi:predicted permease